MRNIFTVIFTAIMAIGLQAQNPTPFSCTSNDGFGYYISSASSTQSAGTLTYSSSRLSKITTSTGVRTTLCTSTQIGVSLNGMAFNPQDKFLYAVSRYDATQFSGKLYRIGENCQKVVIPVTGAIVKFSTNNINTIDAAGGNISSGTFDLDNNYYVNTSFTNSASTGFTNRIQKIRIVGNTATLVSTKTLTCPSCNTTNKLTITDIIFDENTNKLYGSNRQTNQLYSINAATGVITPVGTTGITGGILGMYKNVYGDIRAIDETGRIYAVNVATGSFTFLNAQSVLNSGNADGASGCYNPPAISGNVFIDGNGLNDNIVSGMPVNKLGTQNLYANLVQNGKVVKSVAINGDGFYQFLGLFSGTYEVQISTTLGTVGIAPPAQGLPNSYVFVGDNIGASAGNDGTPDGKLTVIIPVGGGDVIEVNFGIDTKPITADVMGGLDNNPGGTNTVIVPTLDATDAEDGTPTTIIINQIPDMGTQGVLYYNGAVVTNNQVISNFQDNLLTFDPVDGSVTATFNYSAVDEAGVVSNISTVTMEFTNSLPIELLFFGGTYQDKEVLLYWTTATETNTSHFIVQRSKQGVEFENVGEQVAAAGESVDEISYSAKDESPNGFYYYRLKAVDLDETFTYSPMIYIAHKEEADLDVYPTVITDNVYVRYNGEEKQVLVSIINGLGQEVLSARLSDNEKELDLQALAAGNYNIVVKNSKGEKLLTKKIVKQ